MKTFQQFITEGRDAPIYHAGGSEKWTILRDILKTGLEPMTAHEINGKYLRGVSMTRDLHFAKTWKNTVFVLEYDQRRLAQRYRIEAFNYWQDSIEGARLKSPFGKRTTNNVSSIMPRNEYEEFVVTRNNIPNKYITKIYIKSPYIKLFKEKIPELKNYEVVSY